MLPAVLLVPLLYFQEELHQVLLQLLCTLLHVFMHERIEFVTKKNC